MFSTPVKLLLSTAKSPGFITTKVGPSPPALLVTCASHVAMPPRVKPVTPMENVVLYLPVLRLMYWPWNAELPCALRLMPPYCAKFVPLSKALRKLSGINDDAVLLVNNLVAMFCRVMEYASF